jgi:hypothetical protein
MGCLQAMTRYGTCIKEHLHIHLRQSSGLRFQDGFREKQIQPQLASCYVCHGPLTVQTRNLPLLANAWLCSTRVVSLQLAGEETFRKQNGRSMFQIAASWEHKGQTLCVFVRQVEHKQMPIGEE